MGPDDDQRARSSARAALIVFVAFVVVAFPLVLFRLGSYQWFFRDDWVFITGSRAGSLHDLFQPHDGHWSTLPILVFRALWATVGARSYVPYQAVVLALHLTAAVLLRVVMRRAGVGPWIATAAASVFVLLGPGSEDIVWAFQIGFTGSLVFGLVALLLADHPDGIGRRDALVLGAGALSLMCSGVGIVMVAVVGLAVLLRRGWLAALVDTVPLGALYGVYWLVERPVLISPFGRPSIPTVLRWVRSGGIGAFRALGHYPVVSVLLVVLLVVGWVLVVVQPGEEGRARLALPFAVFVGGLAFSVLTAEGRWYLGEQGARASRYIYLGAAFALPALAVAADAVGRRVRWATPALALLLLIAVPANIAAFGQTPFGAEYFASERATLTTAPRSDVAHLVPPDVRPIPDIYLPPGLTIGFLLDAARQGKLPGSSRPLTAKQQATLEVRLGVSQQGVAPEPASCPGVAGPVDFSPPKGAVYRLHQPLLLTLTSAGAPVSSPVPFSPANGQQLTIELSGMHLRATSAGFGSSVVLCRQP